MPAPRGVCWCFGGRPPEITYGIDGETPLKAMEVEVPMPTDEKEIDEKFAEIVVIEFPWKYWILVKERIQPTLEDTIDLLHASLNKSCKRSAEN